MTPDERNKLDRTQVVAGQLHRELCAEKAYSRLLQRWLYFTMAVLVVVVGMTQWLWPQTDATCTAETMGQERAGDLVAMKAQAEWYASQKLRLEEDLGKWQLKSIQDLAARKVAEQELAVRMAQQVVIPEPAPMTQTELMLARMAESKPVQAVLGRFKVAR